MGVNWAVFSGEQLVDVLLTFVANESEAQLPLCVIKCDSPNHSERWIAVEMQGNRELLIVTCHSAFAALFCRLLRFFSDVFFRDQLMVS